VKLALRVLRLVLIAGGIFAVCAGLVALVIGEREAGFISLFNGAFLLLALWWLPKRAVRRRLSLR
jgi:hypothetical protein